MAILLLAFVVVLLEAFVCPYLTSQGERVLNLREELQNSSALGNGSYNINNNNSSSSSRDKRFTVAWLDEPYNTTTATTATPALSPRASQSHAEATPVTVATRATTSDNITISSASTFNLFNDNDAQTMIFQRPEPDSNTNRTIRTATENVRKPSDSVADCIDVNMRDPDIHTGNTSGTVLNITGLFALTGEYRAGLAYLAAAIIAVKVINQRPDILPGYTIRINAHDTKCYEPCGLDAFYQEVYNPQRKSIMVMGGTCSHVTESTAQVSHVWGIPQISYSAVSPFLSNQEIFPSFFRVMSPEQYLTSARIELFRASGWKRVHSIYQNYNLFSTLDESMRQDLKAAGIEVLTSGQMFTDDPTPNVRNLIQQDARIIVASMYEEKLRQVMCSAYHLVQKDRFRTYTWYKRVVWLLPSFIDRHWMNTTTSSTNCTPAQIMEVVGNYFSIGSKVLSRDDGYIAVGGFQPAQFSRIYTGRTLYEAAADLIPPKFRRLYTDALSRSEALPSEHRAGQAYDTVWAIALALNNTLNYLRESGDVRRLETFEYRDRKFSQLLHQAMMNVTFDALSGPFVFNAKGEKSPVIEILRFNNNNDYQFFWVGQCCCEIGKIDVCNCTLQDENIRWENGIPPVDGVQTVERVLTVWNSLLYVFSLLASLGILISLALLAFNVFNKNHRIIKMSSPRLNNVILLGCMFAYCNVLLLEVSLDSAIPMCMIRTSTILLSFSLSFGALFAKTWRVYQIFTAGSALKRLNTKMLRDSSLFLIVSALVIVNSIMLITWSVMSPERPTLVEISITPADPLTDVEYVNLYKRCESRYRDQFTYAAFSLQGVVVLAGTFLAVQTRKVSFPELNDSKWIGVCIYHVVVLCPLGVVVVMATSGDPDISYSLEASIIILVTTMTQGLLFVPKILAYRKHNDLHSGQSESKLSVHKGSLAYSQHSSGRRSDTAHSASSRSCTPSWTAARHAYGNHAYAEEPVTCARCNSQVNQATLTSSDVQLQQNLLHGPLFTVTDHAVTPGEFSREEGILGSYRACTRQEQSIAAACRRNHSHSQSHAQLPGCRCNYTPSGGTSRPGMADMRRSSDSNLNRYILRKYASLD